MARKPVVQNIGKLKQQGEASLVCMESPGIYELQFYRELPGDAEALQSIRLRLRTGTLLKVVLTQTG